MTEELSQNEGINSEEVTQTEESSTEENKPSYEELQEQLQAFKEKQSGYLKTISKDKKKMEKLKNEDQISELMEQKKRDWAVEADFKNNFGNDNRKVVQEYMTSNAGISVEQASKIVGFDIKAKDKSNVTHTYGISNKPSVNVMESKKFDQMSTDEMKQALKSKYL